METRTLRNKLLTVLTMNQIELIIEEAKEFLEQNADSTPESDKWYAVGNFRKCVLSIESNPSKANMEQCLHALRYHIVDQYDWNKDYCKTISDFASKFEAIAKCK